MSKTADVLTAAPSRAAREFNMKVRLPDLLQRRASREVGCKGHDQRSYNEEYAVQPNCQPAAIVQHPCAAQKCSKDGSKLDRAHHQLCDCFAGVEPIPDGCKRA